MILSLQLVRNIFDTTMELCNSLQAKTFVNMFVCVCLKHLGWWSLPNSFMWSGCEMRPFSVEVSTAWLG